MANEQETKSDQMPLRESDDTQFVTEKIGPMNKNFHRFLAAWFIITSGIAFWIVFIIWPTESSVLQSHEEYDSTSVAVVQTDSLAMKAIADSMKQHLGTRGRSNNGVRLLILSLLFGIIGGSTHGLASLMDFRGERRLFKSWSLWYFGRPILGGMMAVIFYVVVRAGLFSGSATSDATNLYGIAAFSALVGMFTDAATNKLAELFRTMFSTQGQQRQDQLTQNTP